MGVAVDQGLAVGLGIEKKIVKNKKIIFKKSAKKYFLAKQELLSKP